MTSYITSRTIDKTYNIAGSSSISSFIQKAHLEIEGLKYTNPDIDIEKITCKNIQCTISYMDASGQAQSYSFYESIDKANVVYHFDSDTITGYVRAFDDCYEIIFEDDIRKTDNSYCQ